MNFLTLLPILIVLTGSFLLVKLRFFFIFSPKKTLNCLRRALREKGALSALWLSLAGTLGVGNIVGVAFGIAVGGAGSVFWLFISAFFSSVLKYSECLISTDAKRDGSFGMANVLKKCFRPFSPVYSALCILLSLTMGTALQAKAMSESAACILGNEKIGVISAFIFTLFTLLALRKGGEKIAKITAYIIPLSTIIYIFLTFSIIFANSSRLLEVIKLIISDAFSIRAGTGGVMAFLTSRGLKEGFSRGLLSNEAGAGTSTLAHAKNCGTPVSSGLVSMLEVFFDTTLLCTLTALAVLLSVDSLDAYSSGIEIIVACFSPLGPPALFLLFFSIASFAFSTVICWYYYGKTSLSFLTDKWSGVYLTLFLSSVLSGTFVSSEILIVISDYLLFFLSVLSLFALIKNSDRLRYLSESEGLITKREFSTKARKKEALQGTRQIRFRKSRRL